VPVATECRQERLHHLLERGGLPPLWKLEQAPALHNRLHQEAGSSVDDLFFSVLTFFVHFCQ
jgi:hypothetical protein